MKTVRELYVEVMANDEQKRAFVEAMKSSELERIAGGTISPRSSMGSAA
jgi:hypothetical protein